MNWLSRQIWVLRAEVDGGSPASTKEKKVKMTTPTPKPSKLKAWLALGGSVLSVAIPVALAVSAKLPPQWQLVVGGVIAILTGLGVYKAPYQPKQ